MLKPLLILGKFHVCWFRTGKQCLNSLIGLYKNGSTVSIMTFIKYATLRILAIGTNAECRN